jgi:hypothetical protein
MASLETALGRYPQNDGPVVVDDDRRDDNRVKVLKQARITGLDGASWDELATVVDLTREGLYFTVRSSRIGVGTELCLTFPDTGSQCTCVTVRVEQLPDGRQGVGARILGW